VTEDTAGVKVARSRTDSRYSLLLANATEAVTNDVPRPALSSTPTVLFVAVIVEAPPGVPVLPSPFAVTAGTAPTPTTAAGTANAAPVPVGAGTAPTPATVAGVAIGEAGV
jgi:hypothetical protein